MCGHMSGGGGYQQVLWAHERAEVDDVMPDIHKTRAQAQGHGHRGTGAQARAQGHGHGHGHDGHRCIRQNIFFGDSPVRRLDRMGTLSFLAKAQAQGHGHRHRGTGTGTGALAQAQGHGHGHRGTVSGTGTGTGARGEGRGRGGVGAWGHERGRRAHLNFHRCFPLLQGGGGRW